MNVTRTANTIYTAICCDPQAQAKIKEEFSSLAVQIATDPNASARVTSATINGQTFTAQSAMTNGERLQLLRIVCHCIDKQSAIQTTLISTF